MGWWAGRVPGHTCTLRPRRRAAVLHSALEPPPQQQAGSGSCALAASPARRGRARLGLWVPAGAPHRRAMSAACLLMGTCSALPTAAMNLTKRTRICSTQQQDATGY